MKKIKKFATLALAVAMSFAMTAVSFAAGLSDAENELLTKISEGFTAGEVSYTFDEAQIAKAENYLMGNDIDDAKINAVISNIDEVVAMVEEAGVSSIDELDDSVKTKIAELAKASASDLDLNATVDADGNLVFTDAEGNQISNPVELGLTENTEDEDDTKKADDPKEAEKNDDIDKTGFGLEATAAVVALLSVAFVSAAIVSKRKSVEA